MIQYVVLILAALLSSVADAQTLARTYTTASDRAGSVAVFGFYNPADQKTYVLDGTPGSFAIPVTGTFVNGPLRILRNSVSTEVVLDTASSANNRPVPMTLLAGDSLGPVATGVGISNSSTLRTHIGNSSPIDTNITNTTLDVRIGDSAGNGLTSTLVGGTKRSLDVNVAASTLPTGASTEATLSTLNGKVTAVNTGAVVVASSALPTGAATEATLAGIRTRQDVVDFGATTTAQRVAATVGNLSGVIQGSNPLQVDIGSNSYGTSVAASRETYSTSGGLPVLATQSLMMGFDSVTNTHREANVDASGNLSTKDSAVFPAQVTSASVLPFIRDFSSSSLTTTYSTVVASTSSEINAIQVQNQGDQPILIAVGAAASEIAQYIVLAGGDSPLVRVNIASGSRISVKTQTGTISTGFLVINAFQ